MRRVKNFRGKNQEKHYEVVDRHCMSLIRGKGSEFRPVGFFNNDDNWAPNGYVYTCPVCNCQRFVKSDDMKEVGGLFSRVFGSMKHYIHLGIAVLRSKFGSNNVYIYEFPVEKDNVIPILPMHRKKYSVYNSSK